MILGVIGALGRMGERVSCLAASDPAFTKVHPITRSCRDLVSTADLLIDFSTPDALEQNLNDALRFKQPLIIGTTGLKDKKILEDAARHIPLLYTSNFSIGMTLFGPLAVLLAKQLGPNFTVSITETHHTHKKDSPSGTALTLAENLGGNPPIASIREGDIIGEHTVTFTSPYEKIVLSHRALSRDVFAEGALTAAKKLIGKPPGLYSLLDLFSSCN